MNRIITTICRGEALNHHLVYDKSAPAFNASPGVTTSRYRQVEAEAVFYEKPDVTLEHMRKLEDLIEVELQQLEGLL